MTKTTTTTMMLINLKLFEIVLYDWLI